MIFNIDERELFFFFLDMMLRAVKSIALQDLESHPSLQLYDDGERLTGIVFHRMLYFLEQGCEMICLWEYRMIL